MDDFDERAPRRAHGGPYTSKHPVPTVQKYRQHRDELEQRLGDYTQEEEPTRFEDAQGNGTLKPNSGPNDDTVPQDATQQDNDSPYPTANRHLAPSSTVGQNGTSAPQDPQKKSADKEKSRADDEKSPTEAAAASIDPKEKRKTMKKKNRGRGTREVTDPVTHLPVVIKDMTDKDLEAISSSDEYDTSDDDAAEREPERDRDKAVVRGNRGMRNLFPPPHFEDTKRELIKTFRVALLAGAGGVAVVAGFITLWAFALGRQTASGITDSRSDGRWWDRGVRMVRWMVRVCR